MFPRRAHSLKSFFLETDAWQNFPPDLCSRSQNRPTSQSSSLMHRSPSLRPSAGRHSPSTGEGKKEKKKDKWNMNKGHTVLAIRWMAILMAWQESSIKPAHRNKCWTWMWMSVIYTHDIVVECSLCMGKQLFFYAVFVFHLFSLTFARGLGFLVTGDLS